MLQQIIDDNEEPAPGEDKVAALTAGDRIPWAKARHKFFRKGLNKASLDAIEQVRVPACTILLFSCSPVTRASVTFQSAFVVVLEDDDLEFDPVCNLTLHRHATVH